MKVILTQDVEKLGDSHEVVDVREGYARNFLVPRGLAMVATKNSLANIEKMKRVEARRQERLRKEAEQLVTALEAEPLRIEVKAGEGGRLFGSVGTADIVEHIEKTFEVKLDRRQIVLINPIRSTGDYAVPVRLHKDIQAQLRIQINAA